jgi:multiple sugar transport system permease protein
LLTALFVVPLVFMVSGSLRRPGAPPPRTPELLPSPIELDNYERAVDLVDMPRYLLNSSIVAASAVPRTVLVASLAAFGATLLSRRAAGVFVAVSLIAQMVPATALLVPRLPCSRVRDSRTRSCR